MSGYVRALQQILNPDLLVNESPLVLEEPQPGGGPPVKLHRSGQALVINLDRFDNHTRFPWLDAKVPRITSLCDYAIVVETGDQSETRTHVLLVELKSAGASGALIQLGNGRLLVDWLLAIARRHGRAVGPPDVVRGIVFADGVPVRSGPRDLARLFANPHGVVESTAVVHLPRAREYHLSALAQ